MFTYPISGGAPAYSGTLLTGLVSWWALEEATGNRADSHGPNTMYEFIDPIGSATGKIADGANFVSANTDYLQVDATHGLEGGLRDWSITGWVLPTTNGLWTGIMHCGIGATAAETDYVITGYFDDLRLYVPSGGGWNVATKTSGLTQGVWTFFHAYYVLATNTLGISVNDGTPVETVHASTASAKGGQCVLGTYLGTGFQNGVLDEVNFYSRALTGSEVTELYNSGNGMAYPGP